MMNQNTYHRLIIMGYPVEQGVQNCVMCHDTWQPQATKLKDTIHQIHMANSTFNAMNGNCMSCHAIDDNGDFVLWDDVKYDQYKGYKLVSGRGRGMEVSYDQDTITPLENQFYKTIKSEPSQWTNDDTVIDPTIYENWTDRDRRRGGEPLHHDAARAQGEVRHQDGRHQDGLQRERHRPGVHLQAEAHRHPA